MSARPVVVLCPHFAPDTAPTGEIFTTIVGQMAAQGRRVHVVTALPWYARHAIEDGWAGRTGLVHRAVMEDFPDLSAHQVYACGVPVMVDAARRDFVATIAEYNLAQYALRFATGE